MGFDTPADHHLMLRDYVRVMAYRSAIFAGARDKVVVDLGCGSGLLSIFAAQAGAKRVYAIEQTKIAGLASLMFKANGVTDRVTLLRGHSREIELPERADLVVHEILGGDPFDEGVLPAIDDARQRFLAPGGKFLPGALQVCCVGIEAEVSPSPTERILHEAQEFGGLYGVNFEPYLLALEAYRDALAVSTGRLADLGAADRIVTAPALLRSVDFDRPTPTGEISGELEVTADGGLGALLIYFRARLSDEIELTNSPFAPRTCWGWAIRDLPRRRRVTARERLRLRSRIEPLDGRQRIFVELE